MKKRVVLGVFVFCLGMTSLDIASAQTATSKKEVINLSLGSVSSSSGIYAFAVSLSNVIQKYDPGIIMWNVNHTVPIDDPMELFPVHMTEAGV